MSKAPLTWKSETRKLRELKPWGKNPRRIDEEQAEHLRASLEKFGEVYPILISPKNHIYDGHQREKVMQMMGNYNAETDIDVRVSSRMLTKKERIELIARLHENEGEWDPELIKELYDPAELEEWGASGMADLVEWEDEGPPPDPGDEIDKADELREKWGTEIGQLWKLGDHRIICGDCLDTDVIERLMAGEKADLGWTDPPYGISYEAEGAGLKAMGHLASDTKDQEQFKEFLTGSLTNFVGALRKGAPYYIFMGWEMMAHVIPEMRRLKAHGHNMLVWSRKKVHFRSYPQDYIPDCEFFLYGWKRGANRQRNFKVGLEHRTIWEFETIAGGDMLHPTQKPLELAENAFKKSSKVNNIVLDLFLGSGTLVLAAERTKRVARAVDIEPKYIAVTLERWHQMTGEMPELIGGMPISVDGKEN